MRGDYNNQPSFHDEEAEFGHLSIFAEMDDLAAAADRLAARKAAGIRRREMGVIPGENERAARRPRGLASNRREIAPQEMANLADEGLALYREGLARIDAPDDVEFNATPLRRFNRPDEGRLVAYCGETETFLRA